MSIMDTVKRRIIRKPAKVLIADIPEGRRFVATLASVAEKLARGFVGMSDDQAGAKLDEYINRVTPAVINALGEENAARLLPGFHAAVMKMKTKLEAARSTQRHRAGGRKRYRAG